MQVHANFVLINKDILNFIVFLGDDALMSFNDKPDI